MRRLVVVVRPDEEDGRYVATAPSVPGVVNQGETVEEAYANAKAALEFTLQSMAECGEEIPMGDEVAREIEVRF